MIYERNEYTELNREASVKTEAQINGLSSVRLLSVEYQQMWHVCKTACQHNTCLHNHSWNSALFCKQRKKVLELLATFPFNRQTSLLVVWYIFKAKNYGREDGQLWPDLKHMTKLTWFMLIELKSKFASWCLCHADIDQTEIITLLFQVEILDSKTKEQLCFLDKVSRFF